MEPDMRVERDSLGEIRVPANALYGAQTQRTVENFPISGLKPWPAFIWSMAVIKRAAAEVHRDLGLLDGRQADAILQAAQEVRRYAKGRLSQFSCRCTVRGQKPDRIRSG